MRPVLAAAAVLTLAHPSAAQEGPARWSDLIAPDRLATIAANYVVLAARLFADVTYADLSVDVASGRYAVSDLSVWPDLPWSERDGIGGVCEVSVGEAALLGTPWGEIEDGRFTLALTDLRAPIDCVPPDARVALAIAGLPEIAVPAATLDVRYMASRSSASVRLFADIDGAGSVEAVAELPYVWLRQGLDEEPVPVVRLSGASLSVEDAGALAQAERFLPPRATEPATAAAFARDLLEPAMRGALAQGPVEELLDPPPLEGSAEALVASAAEAWASFVAEPGRLTLEVAPDRVLSVGPALAKDPAATLEALRPVVTTERPSADPAVEPSLVAAALAGEALGEDDRRRVGLALLTGRGAPRARDLALTLLDGLAVDEPGLAVSVAAALAEADPEDAYARALEAGAGGAPGATALLDAIEDRLPLVTVLRLQEEAAGKPAPPVGERALRRAASDRLSGRGLTRSYLLAATHARLGAASGDARSLAVLERIDAMSGAAAEAEREAWAALNAEAATRALETYAGGVE